MGNYKIRYDYSKIVKDVHHISIDCNGFNYSVIFGKYINGGFFSIPNWNKGGELSSFDDVFWNTESITKALEDENAARSIAEAIKEYA